MATSKKMDLYVENDKGGEDILQVTIKKMKLRHIESTLAVVMQIAETLESQPQLREVFSSIFNPPAKEPVDLKALAEKTNEELDEIAAQKKRARDAFVVKAIWESLRTLLIHLPKQGVQLLSNATRIDMDVLYDQELEVLMEVVETAIEVNEIQNIIERGKQSSQKIQGLFDWAGSKKKN